MNEEKPKRSTCDECRLFTLLTYSDGWERCQNPGCSKHKDERKVSAPG